MTPASAVCSEHALVAAVRSGDDRAFEELYGRYRARIGSFVLGMVGDHGRAEDISQEVFISALRRIRSTERPIAFKPWIYEIAKNACIDHFRRTRRAEEVSLDADGALRSKDRVKLVLATGPQAAVESKERLDGLRGAFGGLSEVHHRVLVMRELEGLSYAEIGERLGMTRPVVESTLFRARKRLLEEYEELVSGRRCERVREVVEAERKGVLGRLGVRERRRLGKHLAHCQPCRHFACIAGFDNSVLETPRLTGRIAALLPLPWLRDRFGEREANLVAGSGSHPVTYFRGLESASNLIDSIGATIAGAPLAAAAAALAIAGAGTGLVSIATGGAPSQPASSTITRGPTAGGVASRGSAHSAVLSAVSGLATAGARANGGGAPRGTSGGGGSAGGGYSPSGGPGGGRPGSGRGGGATSGGGQPGGTTGSRPGGGVPIVNPLPSVHVPPLPHPTLPSLPPVSVPSLPPPRLPPLPGLPSLPSAPPVPNLPRLPHG